MTNRIGNQLVKVFQKNGTKITPIKGAALTEGNSEYILTELSNQATKVFIQEYYLKAHFNYNTAVIPGDCIRTDYDNLTYLVMNLTNDPFRNEIVQKAATLYKTNNTVRIYEETKTFSETLQKEVITWTDKYNLDIPCTLTDTRFGNEISDFNNIGGLVLDSSIVYFARFWDVAEFDRLIFGTGEIMKVESVDKYSYGYAYEITLGEDTR
jgi:hypothetical protein